MPIFHTKSKHSKRTYTFMWKRLTAPALKDAPVAPTVIAFATRVIEIPLQDQWMDADLVLSLAGMTIKTPLKDGELM